MSDKEKQQLVAEVNILRELRHPHIVRYYDRIIDKASSKIFIVMEYCEGGDVGQIIKKCRRTQDYIAEEVIWKIFTQVVLALNECHSRREGKILHRDIKAGNVFLDSSMNVKLGDFGLSKIMSEHSEYAQTHVGTPYYMSPEQIRDSKYNEKSDIWSLGCLLYEMTALHPPFEATTHKSLSLKICSGKFERLPAQYSEELQRVVAWMLCVDLNNRPTVDDLLNLPQVSLRIREKRLKDNQASLRKREEELAAKEEELKQMEDKIATKELELANKKADRPREAVPVEIGKRPLRTEEVVVAEVRRPPRSSTEASFEGIRKAIPLRDSPRAKLPAALSRETSAERIRRVAVVRIPVQITAEQDTPKPKSKRSNFSAENSPRFGQREKRTVSPYPRAARGDTSAERRAPPKRSTSKENLRPQTACSRKEDLATLQEITRYIQAHQRPRTAVHRPSRRY
jgi:NIMA (never in mitosis gene a)-related kinase